MNTAQEETSEELGTPYRARSNDRRIMAERRRDTRTTTDHKQGFKIWIKSRTTTDHKQGFKIWIKSLTSPRLGVDRRKGSDQRQPPSPTNHNFKSLLTQEEISDLLK